MIVEVCWRVLYRIVSVHRFDILINSCTSSDKQNYNDIFFSIQTDALESSKINYNAHQR
jgi:hypothetical protein